MKLDVVRKDAPVAETIERLHGILDSVGFRRERSITWRWLASPTCHSCQLRFTNYPLMFSNGKGVTPELASASALAEFIERLQCLADVFFTQAGNIHRLAPFTPATPRSLAQVASTAPHLATCDFRGLTSETVGPLSCVPFVDVFGKRVIDLPFELFVAITGSSGMAAGNTPEEALAQAICEVFERWVIHAVESGRVSGLPTMELGTLPVRGRVLRQQLEWLASAGIEVIVKDGSLGGLVPVVAVILTDHAARTRHVSFGSDPDFDVALSRCITEAYQGTDRLFRPMASGDGAAAPLDTFKNLEVLLDKLTESVGAPCAESAFSDIPTNAAALRFVIDRVQRLGLGLYVRDFSLFGFPTYFAYVEELSALKELRDESFYYLYQHFEAVRATLFRLARATAGEIDSCSQVLFNEITRCNPVLEKQFAATVLRAPVVSVLDLRTLVVLMLLEGGRLEQARVMMQWRPVGIRDTSSPESVRASLSSYAAARGGAVSADRLAAEFAMAFGRSHAGPGGDGSAPAGPLAVPRCQSVYACPSCPCRSYCRLDEWHRLALRLRTQARVIRHEDLLDRLTT